MSQQMPPGWYRGPESERQFWDGSRWYAPNEPAPQPGGAQPWQQQWQPQPGPQQTPQHPTQAPQHFGANPYANQPQASGGDPKPSNVIAILALVVGVIALVTAVLPIAGIVAGAVALVLAIIALAMRQSRVLSIIAAVLAIIGLVGSLLVTLGVITMPWANDGETTSEPTETESEPGEFITESSGTVDVTDSSGAEVEVAVGFSESGIIVGDPAAPTTIDYYFDFSCPHCVEYHASMGQEYEALIGDREIRVNYVPIMIVQEYGTPAGAALTATAAHEPAQILNVLDELFGVPSEEISSWDAADFADAVESAGVTSPEALGAIEAGDYEDWIGAQTEQALSDGVPGTPSVAVNGEMLNQVPADRDQLESMLG